MKISYGVKERNILHIKVTDRDGERSWVIRQSHGAARWAAIFAEISATLDPQPVAELAPLAVRLAQAPTADPTGEPPERLRLRLQADAARAGASAAKAIMGGDEGEVAKLPEVDARQSAGEHTDASGFKQLDAASAAIDGTVYDVKQYRSDRSNWTK